MAHLEFGILSDSSRGVVTLVEGGKEIKTWTYLYGYYVPRRMEQARREKQAIREELTAMGYEQLGAELLERTRPA